MAAAGFQPAKIAQIRITARTLPPPPSFESCQPIGFCMSGLPRHAKPGITRNGTGHPARLSNGDNFRYIS